MVERIVNVPINFKINTDQVSKYESTVKRADDATSKLRQSTQQFTNQSASGFKFTSKAVEGMEIELARLKQQIKLTSIEDQKRLTMLSQQYKAAKTQLDSYNKSLFEQAKATKQVSANTQNFGQTLRDVYNTAKVLIAANIAKEVVNISLEMSKLAGNVEGVSRAFASQVPGATSVLSRLRDATKGTVTDLELMQKALLAKNFGISLEALPRLLEFAAVRAQQTGQSVDYLVNSIVNGIGRKSLLILDNLQLSATAIKEELHGVSTQAASVGQVSEALGRIAERELGKMGGYAETAATKVDQLTVSTQALRVEFAKWAEEGAAGGASGFLKSYADSFKVLFESWNRGIPVAEIFAERLRMQQAQMSVNEWTKRRLTGTTEENTAAIEEEIAALTKDLGQYAKDRDASQKAIELLHAERGARHFNSAAIIQNIKLIEEGLAIKTKDALIDQEILKLLQERLKALKELNKETGEQPGLIEGVESQIESLSAALKKAKTENQIADINAQLAILEKTLARLKSINKDDIIIMEDEKGKIVDKDNAATLTTTVTAKFAKDAKQKLQEAADNLNIVVPVTPRPKGYVPTFGDKLGDAFEAEWQNTLAAGITHSENATNALIQMEADSYQARIANLQRFYDEQITMAGDNERLKTELAIKRDREESRLRKKAFEAEKQARKLQAVISGAAGIARAFATMSVYEAIVASAIIAAEVATQVAVIDSQQFRGYAKGEVDIKGGKPGKDSIPAMIMPGESVITTDKTKQSKQTLKMIHAGKLNDRMMKELMSGKSGGASMNVFDDSKILKKLDEVKNATPDLTRRGRMIYETSKAGDTFKQTVRSKSMGY